MSLFLKSCASLIAIGAWVWPPVCEAQTTAAADKAIIEDFESANLKDWEIKLADERSAKSVQIETIDEGKAVKLTGPAITELEGKPNETRVQIETVDGDAALHIRGPVSKVQKHVLTGKKTFREDTFHRHEVLAVLPRFQTDTFVLEVGIKGAGGIEFGGGYKVFIGRVGDIGQLMYQPPLQGARRIGTRFLTLTKWNRLKIVCTPSFIRIYREESLIGNLVVDTKQNWPRGIVGSTVALFAEDAYFDDLKVSGAPSPLDATIVVPALPDGVKPEAYAFPASEEVTVQFDVLNYGAAEVQFSLALDEFTNASRREVGKKPVSPGTSSPVRISFDLGRMKPGFYQMHLAFVSGDRTAGKVTWPLAILRSMGGKKEDFVRPLISTSPYLAAMKYTRTRQPFYGNTFIYKILDDLRHYGFTALVDGFIRDEHLDLCQRYGIAVWDRGRPRNHPVVLGALIGDEPTRDSMAGYVREYEKARAEREDPSQLLLTNVIVDGESSCINNFFWDRIKPRHRFCRIYSATGSTTTRDNLRLVGKSISYPGQLKNVQNYGNTPYSIIIPTFGDSGTKARYRDPTPAELKVMMHLSLAYGAKGLFFYTWQSHSTGGGAFVDGSCLRPLDGKLAAASEALQNIHRHSELIHSLTPDSRRVYCSSPWIEAVPVRSGDAPYVYVVNRNIRSHTNVQLSWDPERAIDDVLDVYANRPVKVFKAAFEGDEISDNVALNLLPGDGKLLKVIEKN